MRLSSHGAMPRTDWGSVSDTRAPSLPLVSVVVVNYNYGHFLAEAVESVFAQTYPHVECVVVDNGSTDGSAAVLADCRARHPTLTVIDRGTNGGQTVACIEGLARTNGPYVIFLDADDVLLPHCVASHVAVHLSARVHVGFTSGDMLQVVDGQIITSTNELTRDVFAADGATSSNLMRPTRTALGELFSQAEALVGRVRLVERSQKHWVWAPTSGNCFRRDALDLLCDGEGLPQLTSQTDLYLALGANIVSGSILIDEPLFTYRLHGTNVFSSRAQIHGLPSFDPRRAAVQATLARRLIIDQLVTHVERFVPESWRIWHVLETFRMLDCVDEDDGPWKGRPYAARRVAQHLEAFCAAGGFNPVFDYLYPKAPWRLKLALVKRRVLGA